MFSSNKNDHLRTIYETVFFRQAVYANTHDTGITYMI